MEGWLTGAEAPEPRFALSPRSAEAGLRTAGVRPGSSLRRFMRLIVARCEVGYSGRLSAVLPEALRLIVVKSDGSLIVHADQRGTSRATG